MFYNTAEMRKRLVAEAADQHRAGLITTDEMLAKVAKIRAAWPKR